MKSRWPVILVFVMWQCTLPAQRSALRLSEIRDTAMLQEYKHTAARLTGTDKLADLAHVYKEIAQYAYDHKQDDTTIHYYFRALEIYEQLGDSLHIAFCAFRIGDHISFHWKDYDLALSWLQRAYTYFSRHQLVTDAAFCSYAIARTYKVTGDQVKHRFYLGLAAKHNEIARDTVLKIIMLQQQVAQYLEEETYDKALPLAQQLVALARIDGPAVFLKTGLLLLGRISIGLGQYNEALPPLNESLTVLPDMLYEQYQIYLYIARCHAALGQFQKAEQHVELYRKNYEAYTESLRNINIDELLVRYEAEKKEAALEALRTENTLKEKLASDRARYMLFLIAGLIILVIAGVVAYRNIRRRQHVESKLREEQMRFQEQLRNEREERLLAEFNQKFSEVQLSAMSAQMNPHFIFNCMNSIQKYILTNEKKKALGFLQRFSELMRLVLDNSTRKMNSLDEEIEMLDKYLALEQQRLDQRFDYRIIAAPELQTDFFEVPTMVIQPFVENAIWHGLMNMPENGIRGNLSISFTHSDHYLHCVIEDNGVGRARAAELQKQRSPTRKSHGMSITQKRLELLQHNNGQIPHVIIDDLYDPQRRPSGTRVTINISLDS